MSALAKLVAFSVALAAAPVAVYRAATSGALDGKREREKRRRGERLTRRMPLALISTSTPPSAHPHVPILPPHALSLKQTCAPASWARPPGTPA